MTKKHFIQEKISTLREQMLKKMQVMLDPLLVAEFLDEKGELIIHKKFEIPDSDATDTRAIKAMFNILFIISNTEVGLELTKVIKIYFSATEIYTLSQELSENLNTTLAPIVKMLYQGAPEVIAQLKTTGVDLEHYLNLKKGTITDNFKESDSQSLKTPPVKPGEQLAHKKKYDDTKKEKYHDIIENSLNGVSAGIKKIIDNLNDDIRISFTPDKNGLYKPSQMDSAQVKDTKAILNILKKAKTLYTDLSYSYETKGIINYYWNLYNKREEFLDTFSELEITESSSQIIHDALLALNPILCEMSQLTDDVEASLMLKEGTLSNLTSPAHVGYAKLLKKFKLYNKMRKDKTELPPYWQSRIVSMKERLKEIENSHTSLIKAREKIQNMSNIFTDHSTSAIANIPLEKLIYLKDNLSLLALQKNDHDTYINYLEEAIEKKEKPSSGFFSYLKSWYDSGKNVVESIGNMAGQTVHATVEVKIETALTKIDRQLAFNKRREAIGKKRVFSFKKRFDDWRSQLSQNESLQVLQEQIEAKKPKIPTIVPKPPSFFARLLNVARKVANFLSFGLVNLILKNISAKKAKQNAILFGLSDLARGIAKKQKSAVSSGAPSHQKKHTLSSNLDSAKKDMKKQKRPTKATKPLSPSQIKGTIFENTHRPTPYKTQHDEQIFAKEKTLAPEKKDAHKLTKKK